MIEYEEFNVDQMVLNNEKNKPSVSETENSAYDKYTSEQMNKEHEYMLQQTNSDQPKEPYSEKEVAPTPKVTNKKFSFKSGQNMQLKESPKNDTQDLFSLQHKSSNPRSTYSKASDSGILSHQDTDNRCDLIPTDTIKQGKKNEQISVDNINFI